MANEVKTKFSADTRDQDRAVARLQADLAKYQRQRERDEQALTRLIERQAEQRARAEIRSLQQVQREIERVRREEQAASARFRGRISSAAPYALGGLVGAGYIAQQAIEKAIEQSRANRLLASAATEAGVAQERLVEANRRFAESVGLSAVAAAQTTAQIQRLATYAGQAGEVDRILRAFADLGAARGIGGRDLETLIGTILSGQDEGLNRLGISDPGQLQKAYAASIGKTTEELTQQEKVQAAVNAVLEKAAIFAGAAEARMNSLEGQVAKTSAAWENFTNALATTFTTSGPVTEFINETSKLLQGLSIDIDNVNRKLKEGKTPTQIAQELYPGPGSGDYLTAFGTGAFGLPGLLARTGVFGETARRAVDPNEIAARRQIDLINKITAQQTANQLQQQAAAGQGKPLYQKFLDEYAAGQPARDAAIKKSVDEQAKAAKEAVEKRIDAEKRAAEELKRKLEEIQRAKSALFDSAVTGTQNPFLNFLGAANQRMRSLLETTKDLSPALRDAFIAQQQGLNNQAVLGMRLDARLDALGLRNQAQEFRQGYRYDLSDPTTVQRILDDQLNILRRRGPLSDQRLVDIGRGLDPALIRADQREEIASAFEREANRRLSQEQEAVDFYQAMRRIITESGLKVAVSSGNTLDLTIKDETSTGTSAGTSGHVRARYLN